MWNHEKEAVIEAAQQMYKKGLVVGTSGNVSMRLREPGGRELLAITPTGRCFDLLDVDDIVVADFMGERVEGRLMPSIEIMLHTGVYRARRKVNAIIHSHPVFGSIIAVTGENIPSILDEQVASLGGEIKVADYAFPGSRELAQNVVSALGSRNAVILANHGALSVGRDIREAFTNCELLEKTARVYVNALGLGQVKLLSAEALKAEQAFFDMNHGGG